MTANLRQIVMETSERWRHPSGKVAYVSKWSDQAARATIWWSADGKVQHEGIGPSTLDSLRSSLIEGGFEKQL